MEIRKLQKEEIDEALQLIWQTFLEFEAPDYSEEGVEQFHDFISNKSETSVLEFFGAFEDGKMKGVIATRNKRKHIACFFVAAQYHKQGIGRQLWEYLKENSPHTTITVNSSPFAVPIYHKLGFEDTEPEQISDGIRYTPMQFTE